MKNIEVQIKPEFSGKYYEAIEFLTNIKIKLETFSLYTTLVQNGLLKKLVHVDSIDLLVCKRERKNLEKINYETLINVLMKVC